MTSLVEGNYRPSQDAPKKSLRIIMYGQDEGAASVLDRVLANKHLVAGVVAINSETDPLRARAKEQGIPIFNAENLSKKETRLELEKLEPDLGVAFYFQQIVGPKRFSIPQYGTMNLHLSINERGRDAMNWDILNGKDKLGAMMFLMSRGVDAGPRVRGIEYDNPKTESQGALYYKYLPEYVNLAVEAVEDMARGIYAREKSNGKSRLPLTPQNALEATSHSPLTEADLLVDFTTQTAEHIRDMILAGGPGAGKKRSDGVSLKFLKPEVLDTISKAQPGTVDVSEKGWEIVGKDGKVIRIGQAQEVIDGVKGQRQNASDFQFSFDLLPINPQD